MSSKYRDLVEAAERLCRTMIVDDDFPEIQHRFHGALREARAELDALQADAREKGEVVGWQERYLHGVPGEEWSFCKNTSPEYRERLKHAFEFRPVYATQPAQASEAEMNKYDGRNGNGYQPIHEGNKTPPGPDDGHVAYVNGPKGAMSGDVRLVAGLLPAGTKLYAAIATSSQETASE